MSYALPVYNDTNPSLKPAITMNKFNLSHSSQKHQCYWFLYLQGWTVVPWSKKELLYDISYHDSEDRYYVTVIQCCTFSVAYALWGDEIHSLSVEI